MIEQLTDQCLDRSMSRQFSGPQPKQLASRWQNSKESKPKTTCRCVSKATYRSMTVQLTGPWQDNEQVHDKTAFRSMTRQLAGQWKKTNRSTAWQLAYPWQDNLQVYRLKTTYKSMTMASLEGVEKRPDTPTMLLCRIRANRSYSCRVCSRLRFLLISNIKYYTRILNSFYLAKFDLIFCPLLCHLRIFAILIWTMKCNEVLNTLPTEVYKPLLSAFIIELGLIHFINVCTPTFNLFS